MLVRYLGALRRRGLGGRSVARHLSAVRGLYRFLLANGMIRRDPTEHLDCPRPARRLPRTLSEQDVRPALRPRTRRGPTACGTPRLSTLVPCGLRASEAIAGGSKTVNLAGGYVMAPAGQTGNAWSHVFAGAGWILRYLVAGREHLVKPASRRAFSTGLGALSLQRCGSS